MSIPPRLAGKLNQVLGADASEDLVNLMDEIRADLAELRHDRELVTLRLEKMQESVEKLLERGLREQTRFFFLAWGVILVAIIGLYAR
jgi:hypothetical protein